LRRILGSGAFASSRQLRDFLAFVGDAALAGRTHLDQEEIARHLLANGASFNPNDDSTIRKLASITRHKLSEYYATEGAEDPVVVTLPYRTYAPVFESRVAEPVEATPGKGVLRRRRRWTALAAALAVAAVAAAAFGWRAWRAARGPEMPAFTIRTALGEVTGGIQIIPPGSILLGPQVGEIDQVTVRLRFTPETEYQQAGVMIWSDPNHFVRISRRFEVRPHLEFYYEFTSVGAKGPGVYEFDPQGQTGEPIWLTLRRNRREFRAYTSVDGLEWRPLGGLLTTPADLDRPRLAIYAYNGRREAASVPAVFDRVSLGPEFATWTAEEWAEAPQRTAFGTCEERPAFSIQQGALRLMPPRAASSCVEEVLLPLSGNEVTVSARLDYVPHLGSMAGILVRGDRKGFRIARGEHIRYLFDRVPAIDRPDWSGQPPLYVRLQASGGVLTAWYSRDERDWKEFPPQMRMTELGRDLRYGVKLNASITPGSGAPAHVAYLRQEVRVLEALAPTSEK
jgi:regulation of enolase protein 1 (concanavalin A-like superfamily)